MKELELILDSKTRWDSLCAMLKRFLEMLEPVKKTLQLLNNEKYLDPIDVDTIKELVSALTPIQVTVETLSRNDIDLLKADIILEQLLLELKSLKFDIGKRLYQSVLSRVRERRLESLASISRYLNNPNEYSTVKNNSMLSYCSKTHIYEESSKLLKRLYNDKNSSSSGNNESFNVDSDTEMEVEQDTTSTDFAANLKQVLSKVDKPKTDVEMKDNLNVKSIKRDFVMLEANGTKSKALQRLESTVKAVRPTSTEAERTFSVATNFVNKLRTRLADSVLDTLVFLKFFFIRN